MKPSVRRWPTRARFWLLLAVVTVLVAAAIPLIFVPRFYFLGDTQMGAYGQWFQLGSKLRAGEWPLIDLQAWHGGNYIAEGQWGLFSPVTMAIGLLTTVVEPVTVFVTALKFGLLVLGATGTFLLTRSYGVPAYLCYLAGATVTLGGATQYLDSPDWVTGQMVWALTPMTWWAMRRTANRGANPALALVFGLATVTVGYVYGTLYLIVVIIGCLVDAALARNLAGAIRVLLIGVCCGLVTIAVYLPGILSASVTTRGDWGVASAGRLQADVPGLLASMIPTVLSPASPHPPQAIYPAHYVAWFLPMLLWLDFGKVKAVLRPLAGALAVLSIMVLWALGPNQIGPLRWPIRVMSLLTLVVLVIFAFLWSKAMPTVPSPRRLAASAAVSCFGGYLSISRFWTLGAIFVVGLAAVLLGLIGTWALMRQGRARETIAVFVVAFSLGVMLLQHAVFPWPTSVDRHMPGRLSEYSSQARGAVGDVIVVGNAEDIVLAEPDAVEDFLVASSWYINPHPVQNVYSTIGFVAFNERYEMRFDGATYPDLIDTLFSVEPSTGLERVDLLAVSSIHIVRAEVADSETLSPPGGWRIGAQSDYAVTWVREAVVPSAGAVVWTSPGLDVVATRLTTREAVLQVNAVPADGGRIVFSRLAWPGYRVAGGELVEPTDGYLLTVEVPPGAAGQAVTVSYSPPGWTIELIALWAGLALALVWSVGFAAARHRSRRHARPSAPAPT